MPKIINISIKFCGWKRPFSYLCSRASIIGFYGEFVITIGIGLLYFICFGFFSFWKHLIIACANYLPWFSVSRTGKCPWFRIHLRRINGRCQWVRFNGYWTITIPCNIKTAMVSQIFCIDIIINQFTNIIVWRGIRILCNNSSAGRHILIINTQYPIWRGRIFYLITIIVTGARCEA